MYAGVYLFQGPLLFLLFLNDLPEKVNSKTRLFANDCIVNRHINGPDDCTALQDDLNTLAEWANKLGMAFHPQKCNVLSITRSHSPIKFPYQLKGRVLELQDSSKYRGVDTQSKLSWKNHIDRITKKSNSMLGFLRRNLRSCSEETKANAYFSMVRSNLEYCCSVWSPNNKDQIGKIEMVQRRAARYTTNRFGNTSSVSSMLDHLQWESLKSRRTKIQLTLFFKVVHNIIDIPADKYLIPSTTRTRYAHSKKFRLFSPSIDSFKYSLFPRTEPLWNSLPAAIAEVTSLVSFKEGLSTLSF